VIWEVLILLDQYSAVSYMLGIVWIENDSNNFYFMVEVKFFENEIIKFMLHGPKF
jgi:hypothetical protein